MAQPFEPSPPAAPDETPSHAAQGWMYSATLPERILRGMVGATSAVLRETAQAVVPDAMKSMKLYQLAVERLLRLLVEDVGGLRPGAGSLDARRVQQTAVSSVVDLAGLSTLHLSPLWILAATSDVAYGVKTYLRKLEVELKREGVIAEGTVLVSAADLLGALQQVSGSAADKLDAPPLTLAELGSTLSELGSQSSQVRVQKLLPQAEIDRLWRELQATAAREGRSVFEVSSALGMLALERLTQAGRGAAGTVRVGYRLLEEDVLGHYAAALRRMEERGYLQTLADAYEPYLRGLRHLFAPATPTYTERALRGGWLGRLWRWIRRRLGSVGRVG